MFVGVGEIAAVVVLVGVVFGCAAGVEDDDDDDDDELVEEEEVMVEEDEVVEEDELLVTLKYSDVNRGPLLSFEALYIASQKTLLRERSCVELGLPSQT